MDRFLFIAAAALLCATACGREDTYKAGFFTPDTGIESRYDWDAAADSAVNVLVDRFMDKNTGTFWTISDNVDPELSTFNYWPQAHAMDVIVDAYLRIKDSDPERAGQYEKYMASWHKNRANNYNGPDYYNAYTDDMEWIVLTLLRMYEATGVQEYFDFARDTYDKWIITRWTDDENGGGIRWSLDAGNSKNACSNGPAAICAMRLYGFTSEQKYMDDAVKIYGWLSENLYNPSTGMVADNMTGGKVNGGALSYNQGTFMGAAHLLYKATKDSRYLAEAMKAARHQMDSRSTDGIMNAEADKANSDNALFKGIFIRYATLMVNDTVFDFRFREELKRYISQNAITCWSDGIDKSEGSDMFFNYDWRSPYTGENGYLNPQVSATTLIEAMTRL